MHAGLWGTVKTMAFTLCWEALGLATWSREMQSETQASQKACRKGRECARLQDQDRLSLQKPGVLTREPGEPESQLLPSDPHPEVQQGVCEAIRPAKQKTSCPEL